MRVSLACTDSQLRQEVSVILACTDSQLREEMSVILACTDNQLREEILTCFGQSGHLVAQVVNFSRQ